jgi:hypothetical protein
MPYSQHVDSSHQLDVTMQLLHSDRSCLSCTGYLLGLVLAIHPQAVGIHNRSGKHAVNGYVLYCEGQTLVSQDHSSCAARLRTLKHANYLNAINNSTLLLQPSESVVQLLMKSMQVVVRFAMTRIKFRKFITVIHVHMYMCT